jgi:hypothetical protein
VKFPSGVPTIRHRVSFPTARRLATRDREGPPAYEDGVPLPRFFARSAGSAGVSNEDISGFRHQQPRWYQRYGEDFLYREGFSPYDEQKLTGS